jgi:hypothetical protein
MRIAALLSTTALAAPLAALPAQAAGPYFERVATLPVYATLPDGTDPKTQTSAEIITATPDGMKLIFTDSPGERLGFVDIADPAAPKPAGSLAIDGEPTSVVVMAGTVLAAVNSSKTKTAPTGHIAVVDLTETTVDAKCDVGGQPDSVAASPDRKFLAVAVENERDEEVNDGALPQLPAGHIAIFDLGSDGGPTNCDEARIVEMTGLAAVAPEDPEPEFVDVNAANVAAVTLQENNHVVLIDLASGKVTGHFAAGAVDLDRIDADDDKVIAATGARQGVLREPDAIGWLSDRLVTANEGDYEGGSRGFPCSIPQAKCSGTPEASSRIWRRAMATIRSSAPSRRASSPRGQVRGGGPVGAHARNQRLDLRQGRGPRPARERRACRRHRQ